jgi:hypothetical protein
MDATERLTFEQIQERYAPDWVLIGDPETDDYHRILSGTVLFHSPNRDEVYQKAIDLDITRFAFRCLRPYPEDMVIVL